MEKEEKKLPFGEKYSDPYERRAEKSLFFIPPRHGGGRKGGKRGPAGL